MKFNKIEIIKKYNINNGQTLQSIFGDQWQIIYDDDLNTQFRKDNTNPLVFNRDSYVYIRETVDNNQIILEKLDRPFYGKKISVVIPCKNRINILLFSLPLWIQQTYKNYQIVIVDYNSDINILTYVSQLAKENNVTFSYQVPFSNAKISLYRLENVSGFNMSHAINYGVIRSDGEFIAIAGTDSFPVSFYLETVMSAIKSNNFTRCMWGRLSFSRHQFNRFNGYPESMVKWGGEDSCVAYQLSQWYKKKELDPLLLHNLDHYRDCHKLGINPMFDRSRSSSDNLCIIASYFQKNGLINNYSKKCGQDRPILLDQTDYNLYVNVSDLAKKIQKINLISDINKDRVAVIINDDNLCNMKQWLLQSHQNKQCIFIGSKKKQAENICKDLGIHYTYEYSYCSSVIINDDIKDDFVCKYIIYPSEIPESDNCLYVWMNSI